MRYDLCIGGAGPAGCMLALCAARQGRSVLLLDGGRRHKPNIETLSNAGVALLAQMGTLACLEQSGAIPSAGNAVSWHSPATFYRKSAIIDPWGQPWHVDRERFDRAMREAASVAGAEVLDCSIDRAVVDDSGFRVIARSGSFYCRQLVDATGASARLARSLGLAPVVFDRQLVVSVRFPTQLSEETLALAAFEDGWCYRTPSIGSGYQVVVVTDALALAANGERGLLRAALRALDMDPTLVVERPARRSALLSQAILSELPYGFSVIGDAAWTPDTLSGQGLALALSSALVAAGIMKHPLARTPAEHLRLRVEAYASARSRSSRFFRDRIAASQRAKEMIDGYPMATY